MSPTFKKNSEKTIANRGRTVSARASAKHKSSRAGRERVLVEFPLNLLERTDNAAAQLEQNRSEFIRTAVEQMLDRIEKKKIELELAAAYAANAKMSTDLAEEFAYADNEGF